MANPILLSVDVPAAGSYGPGSTLDFLVHFDQPVRTWVFGGTPSIDVTLSSGTVTATYSGANGALGSAVLFRYTVQPGDADADGIGLGSTINFNGGVIENGAQEAAGQTLVNVGATTAILVDNTAPTVASVAVPSDATYTAGQHLDLTVNFNEAVVVDTGGGTPRISLTLDTGGTVYANYISGSGSSALTFRYTVGSGTEDASGVAVGSLSANGGTLRDGAGNAAVTTLNSVGPTAAVRVDGIADLSIAATSASKPEGSGAPTPFTFTVTRTDDTLGAASVSYAVTGSGLNPADAADFGGALPSGVVNFIAGETSKLITVNVTGDSAVEPAEGFTVTLSGATGGTIGTAAAVGEIANDDVVAPQPEPEPSIQPNVGGPGADSVDGGAGGDILFAGDGADNLRGLEGADTVLGGLGADTVNGNQGEDSVDGGEGDDHIYGGKGDDFVTGGAGDDAHVNGNIGSDKVHGGDGDDTVYGGQDADTVYGDAGHDRVSGDLGNDLLYGGAGADRFAFKAGGGADWIADFDALSGDRIELAAGATYTVGQHQGQVMIDLGGGAVIGLVGVSTFSPDYIVFA